MNYQSANHQKLILKQFNPSPTFLGPAILTEAPNHPAESGQSNPDDDQPLNP
jgi:hypothetical protein